MSWYAFLKAVVGTLARTVAPVDVEGMEHIPDSGPYLLLPNHQSVLDPILVQSAISRNDLHTLTKSTQFHGPFFRWVLSRIRTIPVRRYRVDPQAVRMLLRQLEAGHGVCLYPEGERTWDGSIQPLRRGAVRVILKVGVPIVPCGVAGTFDVWPRWSRRIRRRRVRIRFGEPLHLGRHDDREERERLLEETAERIRGVLSQLSGAPLAPVPAGGRPPGPAAPAEPDAGRSARYGVGADRERGGSRG